MNPKVDNFFESARKWQKEMEKLRAVVLSCGLTEELKWGKPCYTDEGRNIVVIQGFNEYCALLFMKGYLLNDPDGILVKTGENTVVGRQVRFTDAKEVTRIAAILKTYIYQAVEVERAGIKKEKKPLAAPTIPEEFQNKLKKSPRLKEAFGKLTPGRQRAYLFFFSAAKQSQTRESRIEKCVQSILDGKGLNE
jgi:uncharacterized protein YdeI (YjbR/CyaY-like superfamily)